MDDDEAMRDRAARAAREMAALNPDYEHDLFGDELEPGHTDQSSPGDARRQQNRAARRAAKRAKRKRNGKTR